MARSSPISSLAFRIPVVLATVAWGSYFATMSRTSAFGISWRDLGGEALGTLIFTAPLAPFAFLGLGWRRIVAGVMAVCITALIVAEVFGRAQEILVVKHYGPSPTERVLVRRWWPFRHHDIIYDPGYGWTGCD